MHGFRLYKLHQNRFTRCEDIFRIADGESSPSAWGGLPISYFGNNFINSQRIWMQLLYSESSHLDATFLPSSLLKAVELKKLFLKKLMGRGPHHGEASPSAVCFVLNNASMKVHQTFTPNAHDIAPEGIKVSAHSD